MRICAAQTRPFRGDVERNIESHRRLIALAIANGADTIFFPELSITGYELVLAGELATHPDDSRLDVFQEIADSRQITIGVGLPTRNMPRPAITMVLFQPHQARQTYSKKYLHTDEEPFFSSGHSSVGLLGGASNIALAICYEISVPEHAEQASESGAQIYVACVAKTVRGVEQAAQRLSDIAKRYSMMVLMSNCVGESGDGVCGGRSSVWNERGLLLGQLNDTGEGVLIFDTDTQEVIRQTI
ncbi:MAG TPA: carbon-nitrogen hydrolase family protein [Blastocatellia bacterium]|nr:carbon-nitrogen hydrolase family protein [Blastocatellia bacterium]